MVVVILGVSGSGKTTVGLLLAARLGWVFHDADDFHSPRNRLKMSQGVALTDQDRLPWLESLRRQVEQDLAAGRSAVLACSALKASYRKILRASRGDVRFVFLKATRATLERRLAERKGHYFNPALLQSQLATLEEPTEAEALIMDAEQPVGELVAALAARLGSGDIPG